MDGIDRHAGAEVSAIEIEVQLVVVEFGRAATAAIVLLPRSVDVAGRSVSDPAGAAWAPR